MKPQIIHRYTIPLQTVIEQLIGKEATDGEGFLVTVEDDDLVVDIIEPIARQVVEAPSIETPASENAQTQPGRKGGALAQRAGIICGERVFPKFVTETYGVHFQPPAVDHVAIWLRGECGVQSRAELDHDPHAAKIFLEIESKYRMWLEGY
ncbi:hypothetical protein [Mesorhizobium sp.]|uniref:hypothetical protein n=1 Tax=Mesorhizobium sp. TaxID=1871066 RepID=UPI000FEA311C|nr:hypothetical protein [Mesorhizobium sp.]RWH31597.1 MAG: hypothetical protein EOQ76_07215 [Mesorhizobium sp.]TIR57650.1 MAG: hypothetical protein E5X22_22765 [Mesorhizobium sp.]